MVAHSPLFRASTQRPRHAARRRVVVLAGVMLAVALIALTLAPRASAAPASPAAPTASAAVELPPWFSDDLRALAQKYLTKAYAKKYAKAVAVAYAKKVVKKWVASELRTCPDPLPRLYFCTPPPKPRWGRGLALNVRGYAPPEVDGYGRVRQYLRPNVVYWLTCWAYGDTVDNHYQRSYLWYRLTNGLAVNAAWLYTGTYGVLPGVRHC